MFCDRTILLDGLEEKGQKKAIVKTINPKTGQVSSRYGAFTEQNWGVVTHTYLKLIKDNLRPGSFEKIVNMAWAHTNAIQNGGDGMQVDEMDARAQVVDVSDGEDNCKYLLVCCNHF